MVGRSLSDSQTAVPDLELDRFKVELELLTAVLCSILDSSSFSKVKFIIGIM